MKEIRMSYYLVNGQSVSCTVDVATANEMVENYESWLKGERYAFAGQRLQDTSGFTVVIFDKVTHIGYLVLKSDS